MKTAMISSTARDLPEHRKVVEHACKRMSFDPIVMEGLVATSNADATKASIEMVDGSDVFIGVYAYRYGHIPDGSTVSITELEFNRAKTKKIPRLVFLMHEDHAVKRSAIETGEAEKQLEAFKQRVGKEQIVRWFKSPQELSEEVFAALGKLITDQTAQAGEKIAPDLHPPNIISKAPQPYIAHPYSLLQTSQVVGRQAELNVLTDWVTTNRQVPASVRLLNLVAIGGMGKSALTWKWFNDIAPHELPNRAGWMWWSFYESDAHYENFIIRALAYTSGQSEQDVRQLPQVEREDRLWRLLDEKPFVIVLDGLERILLAYSRMDAARMLDDDLDERTANFVARAVGPPESAGQSFIGKHQLRITADQRAGRFLRRLAGVRTSRLLISTRLYPAELQAETGDPLPGCSALLLQGLTDDDALILWREFKVTGSREQLLPLFRSFGNYPLLIRALAGEVAAYRPAPRDFDRWRSANQDFNPAALPLKNAKNHILEFALRGLDEKQRQVLHTLAAFRMPATWDTLRALLTDEGRLCADDRALDAILTELEDRGLMGWDKQANRYDLHPIVRAVVWATLAPEARHGLYSELHTYFDAVPRPPQWGKVESLEDLTPAVELFDKLIGLDRFEAALAIFRDHLDEATHYRLRASRLRVELLERFFPDGVDAPPRLDRATKQGLALHALALAYDSSGEPGRAVALYRRAADMAPRAKRAGSLGTCLNNLADSLRSSGQLQEAESASRRALGISLEEKDRFAQCSNLVSLGIALATRAEYSQSQISLGRALGNFDSQGNQQGKGYVSGCFAQLYLWLRQHKGALPLAQRAWEMARVERLEVDFIRAARLHGEAALRLSDLATAEQRLHHALTRARAVNLVEEELPALTALADLHRRRKESDAGRELLDQVWPPADRGPYPLLHADARNVLACIERDEGHRDAAITAATRAYELAWCDGPPYAYHYGLTNAKQLLAELGAPEPQLPPFDESKFEPMPDVEINPNDEFWIDPATLDSDDQE